MGLAQKQENFKGNEVKLGMYVISDEEKIWSN